MGTKPLARVLGLALVLLALSLIANHDGSLEALDRFMADPALMWITGIFTMTGGLIIVVAHNRWRDGLLAALVSFYGWAAIIKGALFLFLPASLQLQWYQALHFSQFFYVYCGVSLVLGGYLAYGGFKQP